MSSTEGSKFRDIIGQFLLNMH